MDPNKTDEVEGQVNLLTSETYFTSINIEASLNLLQELGKKVFLLLAQCVCW